MRNRPTGPAHPASDRRRKGRRPRFDALEARQLLANFTVTSTADAGPGTLRQALIGVDASADPTNTIDFAFATSGTHIITPLTSLTAITKPVLIDGYSQLGSRANALPQGTNAAILVQVVGSDLGAAGIGFNVQSQGVTIQGLAIDEFSGAAISEGAGSGNDLYSGNYIGPDVGGSTVLGNGNGYGIFLTGPGSTVGGTTPAARNLISGNSIAAVAVTGVGATGVVIAGNQVGTDATGLGVLHNPIGIELTAGATGATIGGTTPLAQNVISSNNTGVLIAGAGTTGNLIAGNYVGPNIAGQVSQGNITGVELSAPGNTIGGPSTNYRNVISGNTADGVLIDAAGGTSGTGSIVAGNFIGTNPVGNSATGNAIGVQVMGVASVTIGGLGGSGNVISGNTNTGVQVVGALATGVVIAGNRIGTDTSGATVVPNALFGVEFSGGSGNLLGGSTSGARNVISGNAQVGVLIDAGADTSLLGNYIGLDATGEVALGNGFDGVVVQTSGNTISANAISANSRSGIAIGSTGITGNLIAGNVIGLDALGGAALGNVLSGIDITAGQDTTIGGTAVSSRNVVSGNLGNGIDVQDGAISSGTVIQGNFIGTDRTGTVALGNGTSTISGSGITIDSTPNATIGGAAGNLISGNAGPGVLITGAGTTGVAIAGNLIGINATGVSALPNIVGVELQANGTLLGGTLTGSANVISGNSMGGVVVDATGVTVAGNLIGLNPSGGAAIANGVRASASSSRATPSAGPRRRRAT